MSVALATDHDRVAAGQANVGGCPPGWSGRGEVAGMKHVLASHEVHLISPKGFDGDGAPVCCQELDLVCCAVGVHLHHGADIASFRGWGATWAS